LIIRKNSNTRLHIKYAKMKNTGWLIVFAADVLLDIIAVVSGWNEIRFISKPLIVISLGIFLWRSVSVKNRSFWLIFAALIFSELGDIFLLFEAQQSSFLLGLLSFLIAHIFFILFFIRTRRLNHFNKIFWLLIVLTACYVTALFLLLSPKLGVLKFPVLIYAIVLCCMFLSSMHAVDFSKEPSRKFCAAGAFLFVISDSLLAINKFCHPSAATGFAVMLTYAIAQFLIVFGGLRLLDTNSHQ
jgi:uncharacterized membrane protein YhhN